MDGFSYKRVFAYSWDIFKQNVGVLIGTLLFLTIISMGTQFLSDVVIREMSFVLGFAVLCVGWVFSVLFSMGYVYLTLRMVRKQKASSEDILVPAPQFFSFVGASLLYGVIVFFGLLLFIVPGIYWSVKYMFFRQAIIDRRVSPLQALSQSGSLVQGKWWRIFGLGLSVVLLNLCGALLFGVGLLITIPLTALVLARVYDRLTQASQAVVANRFE